VEGQLIAEHEFQRTIKTYTGGELTQGVVVGTSYILNVYLFSTPLSNNCDLEHIVKANYMYDSFRGENFTTT
jgi:hypothetical protein